MFGYSSTLRAWAKPLFASEVVRFFWMAPCLAALTNPSLFRLFCYYSEMQVYSAPMLAIASKISAAGY